MNPAETTTATTDASSSKKKLTIDKLNEIYREAESADKEVFAEQRSNILLIAGEHYSKRGLQKTQNRIRANSELSETQKLRLTKNHIHKVTRTYCANIMTYSPGVTVAPQRENDIQSQKSAELNESVWVDGKSRYKLPRRIKRWCKSFVGIGEVCLKLFWNPNAGELLGYEQMAHPDTGEGLVDEAGALVPDESKPKFRGGFEFEEVYGFNLLRHAAARDMHDAECWIVRKMVPTEKLKALAGDDKQKLKFVDDSTKEDFIVFDADKAAYQRVKGQGLLREFYWPPSDDYPEGWFAFSTSQGILAEGPLPFGIFPLVWAGFDEYPTTPRGRSIIKLARPFQAEINRASSQIAMHQITIGDDKVLYQAGTKLQPGALLPGVRGISYAGNAPTILPGRDGGQYIPYVEGQITQMYDVLMLEEESQEKSSSTMDPMSLLYRSLRQQKKFAEYAEKFEEFLTDVCELFLKLAKNYYDDDMTILAVGKKERINISEFKTSDPLSYKIKLEPRDETLETQFGRQLTLNHVLQYASGSLGKDDIGKIIRQMPYANAEEAFSDLTIDYDCIKNDMLMLERGSNPPIGKYDDPKYAVKKLTARTRQPDFQFLNPRVQQAYDARIAQYEQIMADAAQKEMDAKNEFIPSNGAMIAVDMYVENPKGPQFPAKRVRIPYQAVDWLVKRLEAQGQTLQAMEAQNQGVISDMADYLLQKNNGGTTAGSPNPSEPSFDGGQRGSAFTNAPGQALGVS